MNQSNSCTQSQQLLRTESKLMRISPDSLMLGFSSQNTFTLCSMPLTPVILRGVEGEVAESSLTISNLSLGVWRGRPKDLSPSAREVILQPEGPSPQGRGGTACVGYSENSIKGIF